jgi:hypothetical protein
VHGLVQEQPVHAGEAWQAGLDLDKPGRLGAVGRVVVFAAGQVVPHPRHVRFAGVEPLNVVQLVQLGSSF